MDRCGAIKRLRRIHGDVQETLETFMWVSAHPCGKPPGAPWWLHGALSALRGHRLHLYCSPAEPPLGLYGTSTAPPLGLCKTSTRLLLHFCALLPLNFDWTSTHAPMGLPLDLHWTSAGPLLDAFCAPSGPTVHIYLLLIGSLLTLCCVSTGPAPGPLYKP